MMAIMVLHKNAAGALALSVEGVTAEILIGVENVFVGFAKGNTTINENDGKGLSLNNGDCIESV